MPQSKGDKVIIKAHGGTIDIQGVTVAKVDDAVRLQDVDTWFDPMEMFRQIAGNSDGIVQTPDSASEQEEAIVQGATGNAGDAVRNYGKQTLDGSETLVIGRDGIGEERVEVGTNGASGCPFFDQE